jgi:hypothetical protein
MCAQRWGIPLDQMIKCDVCHSACYCSLTCQQSAWPSHRLNCKPVTRHRIDAFDDNDTVISSTSTTAATTKQAKQVPMAEIIVSSIERSSEIAWYSGLCGVCTNPHRGNQVLAMTLQNVTTQYRIAAINLTSLSSQATPTTKTTTASAHDHKGVDAKNVTEGMTPLVTLSSNCGGLRAMTMDTLDPNTMYGISVDTIRRIDLTTGKLISLMFATLLPKYLYGGWPH